MGTNYYYVKFKRCKECENVSQEKIHIGKSSAGWKFHFQYESFDKPENWKEELKNKFIFDEYNREITYREFIDKVESKQGDKKTLGDKSSSYYKLDKNFFIVNDYEFLTGSWS